MEGTIRDAPRLGDVLRPRWRVAHWRLRRLVLADSREGRASESRARERIYSYHRTPSPAHADCRSYGHEYGCRESRQTDSCTAGSAVQGCKAGFQATGQVDAATAQAVDAHPSSSQATRGICNSGKGESTSTPRPVAEWTHERFLTSSLSLQPTALVS